MGHGTTFLPSFNYLVVSRRVLGYGGDTLLWYPVCGGLEFRGAIYTFTTQRSTNVGGVGVSHGFNKVARKSHPLWVHYSTGVPRYKDQ